MLAQKMAEPFQNTLKWSSLTFPRNYRKLVFKTKFFKNFFAWIIVFSGNYKKLFSFGNLFFRSNVRNFFGKVWKIFSSNVINWFLQVIVRIFLGITFWGASIIKLYVEFLFWGVCEVSLQGDRFFQTSAKNFLFKNFFS